VVARREASVDLVDLVGREEALALVEDSVEEDDPASAVRPKAERTRELSNLD
jgi:hypothetical protein